MEMGTPERSKINTPLSNLEGSPVFNYMNNLSPLKPVKSVHITQTWNSLSIRSPPPVFTSPRVNMESKFYRRLSFLDTSMPKAPADSTDQRVSNGDSSFELSSKQQFGSSGYYPLLTIDETNSLFELRGEEVTLDEMYHCGLRQIATNIEGSDCDWNNLVGDASDLLLCTSSSPTMVQALKGMMNKQLDPSIWLSNFTLQSTADNDRVINSVASGLEHEIEDHRSEPTYIGQTQNNVADVALMASNPSDELVYVTHQGTGTSRRCLDFEMATSVQRNNSNDGSNTSYGTTIGLHLNAPENEVQPTGDCSQSTSSSDCMVGEDFHQKNNLKKRRHKLEPTEEGESCKQCNCRKSKCLKLYCECFSAGVYCIEPCSCRDCLNKPINEHIVVQARKQMESRNPLAFAPKVIRSSDCIPEFGDEPNKTLALARHKRGCSCKKSSCQKRYCECYQGGVGCSIICRCEGCKNVFGLKDVSTPAEIEAEPEEIEACEKGGEEKALQKTEDHPDCALPTTPFRPLLPLPFSSKGKPPRSFVDTIKGSQSKFEKPFQTLPDDDNFPVTCVTTSSPKNGKRISTPTREPGLPPTRRGDGQLKLSPLE